MNRELCLKIDRDIKETGAAISTADVDVLLIKQDGQVEFGLNISHRKHRKLSLFEFNIEKQISLEQFVQSTRLDLQNAAEVEAFLKHNCLLKLRVVHDEGQDPRRQRWREKALEILDEHQVQLQFGDSAKATSILFNSV